MTEKKEKKRKPLPITMSGEDFVEILRHTISKHHKIAFLIAFESGLRISEVLALQKHNFHYKDDLLQVLDGKGGKDRFTNIPKHWKKEYEEFIPIPCGKRSLQTAFETAATKAGVRRDDKKVHFHTLRHGYATRLYEKDMKLSEIQKLLGHENINTTLVYAYVSPKKTAHKAKEMFC